jgi:hypothetical protein
VIPSNQQLAAAKRIRITKSQVEAAFAAGYRTLSSVGKDFGVTRARMGQLTKRYGINTHYAPKPHRHCQTCGKRIYSRKRDPGYCREHKLPAPTITRPCGWCNTPVTRSASTQRVLDKNNVHGKMFCSSKHRAWWQGKNGYYRPRKVML